MSYFGNSCIVYMSSFFIDILFLFFLLILYYQALKIFIIICFLAPLFLEQMARISRTIILKSKYKISRYFKLFGKSVIGRKKQSGSHGNFFLHHKFHKFPSFAKIINMVGIVDPFLILSVK